jgi:hypothetical protein
MYDACLVPGRWKYTTQPLSRATVVFYSSRYTTYLTKHFAFAALPVNGNKLFILLKLSVSDWPWFSYFTLFLPSMQFLYSCSGLVAFIQPFKLSLYRISKILTMVYNTQNYWGYGLCPPSEIPKTRKNNVSETGSVSKMFFWFLEFRTMEKVQNPRNSDCHCKLVKAAQ